MPVRYDNFGDPYTPNGSLSFFFGGNVGCSWSHTVNGGADRMLIVAGQYHDVTGSGISSVNVASATYGGTALTALATVSYASLAEVTLFYLKNPPVGTATVSLSWSSPQVDRGCMGNSLSVSGVKDIGLVTTNTGSSATSCPISPTPISNGGTISLIVNHSSRTFGGITTPYFGFGGDTTSVALAEAAGRGVLYLNANTTAATLSGSGNWAAIGATLFGDSPFFGAM